MVCRAISENDTEVKKLNGVSHERVKKEDDNKPSSFSFVKNEGGRVPETIKMSSKSARFSIVERRKLTK